MTKKQMHKRCSEIEFYHFSNTVLVIKIHTKHTEKVIKHLNTNYKVIKQPNIKGYATLPIFTDKVLNTKLSNYYY